MSARRRHALALLVATLAPRAAGEEATLASLTGLFQREPERAAALVASAREGARAINQSRHSEGHETYFRQRRRIEAAVGDYKFYVHAGGAFDAITTDLFKGRPDHKKFYGLAEELAEVWVHRALLADKRRTLCGNQIYGRTLDPAEATLFFVPAYLTANKKRAGHEERLDGLVAALKRDPYFQKNGGRDHVFGYSSWNPGVAKGIGLWRISKLLKQGHFGVFEVNNAWIAANQPQAGRLDLKDRMIPMPYVVNAATFRGDHREVHTHEISVFLCVFFAAKARGNAVKWAGCDRRKGLGLKSVPRASIHVHNRRLDSALEGRRLLDQATFAHHMRVADFCLVMCGDTPTSRRIFDAIIADCIPLIVGTRLWGRCEKPCKKGWGWSISGPDHPHLPFHDTFIDYTRFPRVDEAHFYVDAAEAYRAAVANVTEAYEHAAWRYLHALRDDVVYGYGSPFTSTHFGRAAANLMDTVALKLKHGDRVPDELRPENHSPLGAPRTVATRALESGRTPPGTTAHAHHTVQEASVDTPTAFEDQWL